MRCHKSLQFSRKFRPIAQVHQQSGEIRLLVADRDAQRLEPLDRDLDHITGQDRATQARLRLWREQTS